MAAADPVVVVGGGIAGHAAAVALGEAGADVVLLEATAHAPYDRPELSKHVLVGDGDAASVTLSPDAWWGEHGVELVTGARVTTIDDGSVTTAAGVTHPWSSLVLATGTTPRRLPIPGADLAGVLAVNDLDGALRCAAALELIEHVAVVGAGFIGCEAAAALRRTGRDVTMIDAAPRPLAHAVGDVVADWFTALHRDEGVRLRLGCAIEAFLGDDRVTGVRLGNAEVIDADLVIVAIGVTPNVALARAAGCAIDDGVVVDALLRTTREGVYAIGDIASAPSRFVAPAPDGSPARYRSEHYNVAIAHGTAVARTILGDGKRFDALPTFWTDQFDLTINAAGPIERADEVIVRGSLDDHDFLALSFLGDQLIGGLACAQRRELRALKQLLERDVRVPPSAVREQSLVALAAGATPPR